MKYTYQKLRGKIREKYGRQEDVAKLLGITPVALSNKLNGKADFRRKEIILLTDLLEINLSEIGAYFFDAQS